MAKYGFEKRRYCEATLITKFNVKRGKVSLSEEIRDFPWARKAGLLPALMFTEGKLG